MTAFQTSRVARWNVYFQTKNTNFALNWRASEWKMLVYFMAIWEYLTALSAYLVTIWYILWSSGIYFPFLVCFTKKNLATVEASRVDPHVFIERFILSEKNES
jgi:hypothetical protein